MLPEFILDIFPGSNSDEEIVKDSGILSLLKVLELLKGYDLTTFQSIVCRLESPENITKAMQRTIEPKFKKQKLPKKTKCPKENILTENDATKRDDNACPRCHKVYLRKGLMKKHLLSEKCVSVCTNRLSSTL